MSTPLTPITDDIKEVHAALDRVRRNEEGEFFLDVWLPKGLGEGYTQYAREIAEELQKKDYFILAKAYANANFFGLIDNEYNRCYNPLNSYFDDFPQGT